MQAMTTILAKVARNIVDLFLPLWWRNSLAVTTGRQSG
jgi:hypothetical protein